MIVIDASAVVAILNQEPDYETLALRFVRERERRISPVSSLEAVMALARKYADPARIVETFLDQQSVLIHPIDAEQMAWAQRAFLVYGKGRHPAGLNLGDCFSYAAAKALDASLLYVGGDFTRTDVEPAR